MCLAFTTTSVSRGIWRAITLTSLHRIKLTRPTEAGAKAEAEATKSNDTAAENFMVNSVPVDVEVGYWKRRKSKGQGNRIRLIGA